MSPQNGRIQACEWISRQLVNGRLGGARFGGVVGAVQSTANPSVLEVVVNDADADALLECRAIHDARGFFRERFGSEPAAYRGPRARFRRYLERLSAEWILSAPAIALDEESTQREALAQLLAIALWRGFVAEADIGNPAAASGLLADVRRLLLPPDTYRGARAVRGYTALRRRLQAAGQNPTASVPSDPHVDLEPGDMTIPALAEELGIAPKALYTYLGRHADIRTVRHSHPAGSAGFAMYVPAPSAAALRARFARRALDGRIRKYLVLARHMTPAAAQKWVARRRAMTDADLTADFRMQHAPRV